MFVNKTLFDLTKGIRIQIFNKFLFGLVESLTYLGQIYGLGQIVSLIYARAELSQLTKYFALIVASIVVRSFFAWWEAYYGKKIIGQVKNQLRQRAYSKLLRLGPGYLVGERTGELEANIVAGVDYLEAYLTQYIPHLGVTIVTGVSYSAYIYSIAPALGFLVLASFVVAIISPVVFGRPFSDSSKEHWAAYGEVKADLLDAVQGMDTLKAYGIGDQMGAGLAQRMRKLTLTTMRNLKINLTEVGIAKFAMGLGASFTLSLAAYMVYQGRIEVAYLTFLLFFMGEIFRPVQKLQGFWHNAFMGYTSSKSIYQMLNLEEKIQDRGKIILRPEDFVPEKSDQQASPAIEFINMDFSYDDKNSLFTSLNLAIDKGQSVALVGESGSGKSSIFNLLMRFYQPQAGQILVNGKPVEDYSLESLRKCISLVSQDTYLFHGTIRQNIAMAKPDASQAEIEAAAKVANIHDFIQRLDQGYDSLVGERGLNFSGGQRQRLSIARAILKDAPLLLLDEATSSVDVENEKEIQKSLESLMEGKTSITIAHRLSTIENAQKIYVLQSGQIVECGSHQDLVQQEGAYYRLLDKQLKAGGFESQVEKTGPGNKDGQTAEIAQPQTEQIEHCSDQDLVMLSQTGKHNRAQIFKQMFFFLKTDLPCFLRTLVEGILDKGLGLIIALFGAYLVALTFSGQGDKIPSYMPWLFVLILIRSIAAYLEMYEAHALAYRILEKMRNIVFKAIHLSAPISTRANRTGKISSIVLEDVEILEGFYAHTVSFLIYTMVLMAIIFVPLFILYPSLAWIVALVSVAIIGLPFLLRPWGERLGKEMREKVSYVNAEVVDSVQGLKEILLFNHDRQVMEMIRSETLDLNRLERQEGHRLGIQQAILNILLSATIVACALICHQAVANQEMSPNLVPVLLILSANVYAPIMGLSNVGMSQAKIRESMIRVNSILNLPSNENLESDCPESDPKFVLEFQGVDFSYVKGNPVLKNLSFRLKAGEKLALAGESGVGKTTIAMLATRFYRANQGHVFLSGQDINSLPREKIARRVAYVSQDTYLFNLSILENIRMVRAEASDAEVYAAAKIALADDFIRQLPEGYDSIVGEGGAKLSGGEKQRISIARAILKGSPIIIMDEATSSLDAGTELAFIDQINQLKDRSLLIIAHRESTLNSADRQLRL